MNDLFLIAHKVRGEPAFDIAQRLRCANCHGAGGHGVLDFETGEISDYEGPSCDECNGLGFWWIIPTSGHRAYPWWHTQLNEWDVWEIWETQRGPMPPSLPDHYACNDRPLALRPEAKIDLRALGLVKPKPPIDRRI